MEIEFATLIDSIVKTLSIKFGNELTIYDGKITQNLEEPCIMVTEDKVKSDDELHNRRMENQIIEFEIHCRNKSITGSNEDTEIYSFTRKIAYKLRDILPLISLYKYNENRTEMIETDEKVRGFNFNWHVDNGKGYVYMTYKYRIIEKEELEKIQSLENTAQVKQ